jgi:hypothetical protein
MPSQRRFGVSAVSWQEDVVNEGERVDEESAGIGRLSASA